MKERKNEKAASGPLWQRAEQLLLTYALALPEAHEEFPWGERVVKVKKKVFVFMGRDTDGSLGLSVKLPRSAPMALLLPFTEPTGYGLGQAGWVSARFDEADEPPVDMLRAWIEESFRAVAPKSLVARLDARGLQGQPLERGEGEAREKTVKPKTAKRDTPAAPKRATKKATKRTSSSVPARSPRKRAPR